MFENNDLQAEHSFISHHNSTTDSQQLLQYECYSVSLLNGWVGGTTGSASDQQSEGCGFEAY